MLQETRHIVDLDAERRGQGQAAGDLAIPDWLLADRTVRMAGRVLLPLPTFFTDAQCRHALDAERR